jgi:alpha-beta hydrolase superfamily lysophospholipase
MRRRSLASGVASGLAAIAVTLATLVVNPSAVGAQANPYERGPAPTDASLRASRGPYATQSTTVSSTVTGFGGGRIYYPSSTSDGTFGALVIAPGFTAGSTSYTSLAERVASHGFVTFAIDTNSRSDFPDSRGDQILAALDYLTTQSTSAVRSRIDSSRLAVSGHSMGGGGTLAAANERPSIQAAVALQPWHSTKSWSGIRVPTMIIGAENDSTASPTSHSEPFYTSIPAASEKAYVELNAEGHFAGNSNPADQARAMIAWLKRYVDDDLRYETMICPPPTSSDYSEWRHTCPGGDGVTPPPTTPPGEECEWWQWWCD